MDRIVVSLVGGLSLGGMYALIALGLVLALRATEVFNFAHGHLMTLPAFAMAAWQTDETFSTPVAGVLAFVLTILTAVAFYRVVLRRTVGLPLFIPIIATLGLASILDGLIAIWWGSRQYVLDLPGVPDGTIELFGAGVDTDDVVIAAVSVGLGLAVGAWLRFTHFGTQVRAAGQDAVLASQGGIPVHLVYMVSWALAGALAASAGIAFASTTVVTTSLIPLAAAAFPALLLGGIDSIEGAILGGLLVGVLQGFVATYVGGEYTEVVTYSVLLVVLLVRPSGLLGTPVEARV